MLPLGRKNARRCTECDITCHANCAHLVPDFCGMSMETANALLRDWKDINKARSGRAPQQKPPSTRYSAQAQQPYTGAPTLPEAPTDISADMGRLKLAPAEPPVPAKAPDYGYGRTPQSPPKELRSPETLPSHMQQQAPSPYPSGSPVSATRPLPGGPAGRPPFPSEPVQPHGPPSRASTGFDQQDPFAYQVRLSTCIFEEYR